MKTKNKRALIALASVLPLVLIIVLLQPGSLCNLNKHLQDYLSSTDEFPSDKTFDAAYILGGGQESLKTKYIFSAAVFASGKCKKILILSRQGTTEYDLGLGRNLTNDEWSLIQLKKYGVPSQNIQLLKIESGYFGTYSEAKYVSKFADKNDLKSLLVITSPHHTNRVKKSFAYFFDDVMTNFCVAASDHEVNFLELLAEFLKVKFYQLFLLT